METSAATKPHPLKLRSAPKYAGLARVRRSVQAGTFAFFLLLPAIYSTRLLDIHGSLYAMDLWGFLVIDPVFAVQKWILGEGSGRILLGVSIPVVLALVLGPVFCGWMCPFGFLAELGGGLRKSRGGLSEGRIRAPWKGRFVILPAVFIVATAIHYPVATRVSMPGALTLGMSAALTTGVILIELWIVAFVLLLDFAFSRFWCTRVCMQGSLLSLLRTPWTLRVRHDESVCLEKNCTGACRDSCPIGVDPRAVRALSGCTNCGVCLTACSKQGGALAWGFRR